MFGKKMLKCIILFFATAMCTLAMTPAVSAQQKNARLTQAEKSLHAGRYRLAGMLFRQAFAETGDVALLKRAGEAYFMLGSNGREDAISSFREYAMNAKTPEQAEEAERLLKAAQAIPKPPEPLPSELPPEPPPAEEEPAALPEPIPAPASSSSAPVQEEVPPATNPYTPPVAPPSVPAAVPPPVAPPPAAPPPPAWEESNQEEDAEASADGSTRRFGASGNVVLAVDRIGVIQGYKIRVVDEAAQQQVDQTGFDINLLFFNPSQGSDARPLGAIQVSSLPRFSVDGFAADSFSMGGVTGLSTSSASMKNTDGKEKLPNVFVLFLGPRIGYAPGLGRGADLWLTSGLGYVYQKMTYGDGELKSSYIMLNLEATVVAGLSDGLGLGIGAFFDGTLYGQYAIKDSEGSQKYGLGMIAGGIKLGLLGWVGKESKERLDDTP